MWHIHHMKVRSDGNNFIAEIAAAAVVIKACPPNLPLLLRIDSMATIGAISTGAVSERRRIRASGRTWMNFCRDEYLQRRGDIIIKHIFSHTGTISRTRWKRYGRSYRQPLPEAERKTPYHTCCPGRRNSFSSMEQLLYKTILANIWNIKRKRYWLSAGKRMPPNNTNGTRDILCKLLSNPKGSGNGPSKMETGKPGYIISLQSVNGSRPTIVWISMIQRRNRAISASWEKRRTWLTYSSVLLSPKSTAYSTMWCNERFGAFKFLLWTKMFSLGKQSICINGKRQPCVHSNTNRSSLRGWIFCVKGFGSQISTNSLFQHASSS